METSQFKKTKNKQKKQLMLGWGGFSAILKYKLQWKDFLLQPDVATAENNKDDVGKQSEDDGRLFCPTLHKTFSFQRVESIALL